MFPINFEVYGFFSDYDSGKYVRSLTWLVSAPGQCHPPCL